MGRTSECFALRVPPALYVNFFEVSHSALEFLVDLGQYEPERAASRLHTRVVTGPVYAKLLSRMLQAAISEYEAAHGAIDEVREHADSFELVKNPAPSVRPARRR